MADQRYDDPFRPPEIPILVHCIHCDEEYDSFRIQWEEEVGPDGRLHGFWSCPIEDCDGRGYGFDIFPVDADHYDQRGGWVGDEEDEDEQPWTSGWGEAEDDDQQPWTEEFFLDDDVEAWESGEFGSAETEGGRQEGPTGKGGNPAGRADDDDWDDDVPF